LAGPGGNLRPGADTQNVGYALKSFAEVDLLKKISVGVSFAKNYKDIDMTRARLVNNSRLLKNLNTYINEDHIFSSISQLRNEVFKIESVSGRSLRTIKLRNEIARLEDQLSYSKNQANLRTQQYCKTKSED